MAKEFIAKAIINKKNNQINVSIPRKIISKEVLSKISKGKKLKIKIE